ncbi:MAG: DsrE family protein [Ectothiorhodospiraceae bacterium]|nr:DsrE family protein [Ectothiorhodospiraceae bacterium]
MDDPGLAIVLWAAGADDALAAATPFVFAAASAALDHPVEVLFTSRSVRLLVDGVAQGAATPGAAYTTLYGFMQAAHTAGARFHACSMALTSFVVEGEVLIAEHDGVRNVTAVIAGALEHGRRMLVF